MSTGSELVAFFVGMLAFTGIITMVAKFWAKDNEKSR